jgi:hypothetical protein
LVYHVEADVARILDVQARKVIVHLKGKGRGWENRWAGEKPMLPAFSMCRCEK